MAEHHASQNPFEANYFSSSQAFWKAQLFPRRTEEWVTKPSQQRLCHFLNSGGIQRAVAIPRTALAKHPVTCDGPG